MSRAGWCALAVFVAACGSVPPQVDRGPQSGAEAGASTGAKKPPGARRGGYYKDDGPADEIPVDLAAVPNAEPKWEPLHKGAQRPYVVFGQSYVPNTAVKPYKARGIASWYGRKFHGQKTSIGEPYDMFAMTAAHTTLALPSYARVTNPRNGASVIVRVTDRGPFHPGRIIDLSYAAAWKLGIVNVGSGEVEVEAIVPGEATGVSYAQVSAAPRPELKPATRNGDDGLGEVVNGLEKPELSPSGSGKATWLQLGAFANRENADSLRSHLGRELEWLADSIQVHSAGGVLRVQVGPYKSRADADKVAERISAEFGAKPTVVVR